MPPSFIPPTSTAGRVEMICDICASHNSQQRETITMIKIFTISALMLAAAGLTACSSDPVQTGIDSSPIVPIDHGPGNPDATGIVRCSVGAETYDKTCGFRVVRKPGGAAEIWISNIAYNDRVVYRVLNFAQGEFTTRGGDSLDYSRSSDNWLVTADGREHYKIPDALIVGG